MARFRIPLGATRLAATAALALTACGCAPSHSQTHVGSPGAKCRGIEAPDRKLCAQIVPVGKHQPPFNEDQVDICSAGSGRILASKSFKSPDGEHGRNVAASSWTPDSRFFVFSTASSGGHSPWHWQTYFYDRKRNSFAGLDQHTGPVIRKDFRVGAPDVVEVVVQGTATDPVDIQNGSQKSVHLRAIR